MTGTHDTPASLSPVPALIRRVLIANRGEIACRVIRTCRAMGIATVAVYSDADARALHVAQADDAARLPGNAATDTYLHIPALLSAARRCGADAVHPGYGFLAESAPFAVACNEAGLTFIGPTPEVIARMGSKREARRLVAAAGVPVVPGYDAQDQSDVCFVEAAARVGYPVLVKAAAGGGGKGMRVVQHAGELAGALAAARREALSAFGDGTLLLERLVTGSRHVEFQIFGDTTGHVIHLGERECTVQRRHQKVIEETPSPALDDDLRARMAAAAVTVGRLLGYTNAGTVEFILAPDGSFYFLEVNTRLQVEHPVTELVTGLDLVRWQILVAEGRPLPLSQDAVTFSGHAVEARVYAEHPAHGFLPATGPLTLWRDPAVQGARVDGGVRTGDDVSIYYDPMLTKISAHAPERGEALRLLDRALATTVALGVHTNLDYLRRVVMHPAHLAGDLSTDFLERHAADLLAPPAPAPGAGPGGPEQTAALVVALHTLLATGNETPMWRNNPSRPFVARLTVTGDQEMPDPPTIEVQLTPRGKRVYRAHVIAGSQAVTVEVVLVEHEGPDLTMELDGHRLRSTAVQGIGHEWWIKPGTDAPVIVLEWQPALREPEARGRSDGSLLAPMPGQVIAVLVSAGQEVREGDTLLILEAMKMEHPVRAPYDGQVRTIYYQPRDNVRAAALLLEIERKA